MFIYLDESGDLGFREGATNFFVISFITMDNRTSLQLKRKIKRLKQKYKVSKGVEIKGNTSSHSLRVDVLRVVSSLPIEIYSIVVNKQRVNKPLRDDTNIFYNYMVNLIMVPYLERKKFEGINIIADLRITRVARGMRFADYLKYKLFFENRVCNTKLNIQFLDSLKSNGLQAADFVSYSLFRKYESRDIRYYRVIERKVREDKKLFFK